MRLCTERRLRTQGHQQRASAYRTKNRTRARVRCIGTCGGVIPEDDVCARLVRPSTLLLFATPYWCSFSLFCRLERSHVSSGRATLSTELTVVFAVTADSNAMGAWSAKKIRPKLGGGLGGLLYSSVAKCLKDTCKI